MFSGAAYDERVFNMVPVENATDCTDCIRGSIQDLSDTSRYSCYMLQWRSPTSVGRDDMRQQVIDAFHCIVSSVSSVRPYVYHGLVHRGLLSPDPNFTTLLGSFTRYLSNHLCRWCGHRRQASMRLSLCTSYIRLGNVSVE